MRPFDRYLKELRTHLPGDEADDIVAELEVDLREELEDREAQLGRALTDSEQEAILKRHGKPILAAARYRPEQGSLAFGRQLIGPALFPAYTRVLTINLAVTLVVVITTVALVVANGQPLGSAIQGIPLAILIQFGVVTTIFVAAERTMTEEAIAALAEERPLGRRWRRSPLDWVADQLIGREHPVTIPRRTSVSDLALIVIPLGWLVVTRPPTIVGFLRSGPGWEPFHYAAIVILGLAAIPPLVNLIRPAWTRLRTAARLLSNLAFGALFVASSVTGRWLVLADDAGATTGQRTILDEVNRWIGVAVAVALGITVLIALLELRRVVARRRGDIQPGARMAV